MICQHSFRKGNWCNYSLRYWSYFLCSYLPPTWPSLAMLEGGSCTVPEAVITVLCTPNDGLWLMLEGGSCTVPEAVVTVLCTPNDGCG